MSFVVGAFALLWAGAASGYRNGLVSGTDRGHSKGQMHERILWEPGRSRTSCLRRAGLGGSRHKQLPGITGQDSEPVMRYEKSGLQMGIVTNERRLRNGKLEVIASS